MANFLLLATSILALNINGVYAITIIYVFFITCVLLTIFIVIYIYKLKKGSFFSDVCMVLLGWAVCFCIEYLVASFLFYPLLRRNNLWTVVLLVLFLNIIFLFGNIIWAHLWFKHTEIVKYIIGGGFTTFISFITYLIFSRLLGFNKIISQVLSWIFSVTFAFFINKYWIFNGDKENKNGARSHQKEDSFKSFSKEVFSFIFGRLILSFFFEWILFFILNSMFNINDIIVKIITTVVIFVVNYFLSKFFVFNLKKIK